MKYLKQAGIILFISFAGELIHSLVPLPVPASIYGLIIMLVMLLTGVLRISSIRETSAFLIDIMPVMFIPAATGLMTSWGIIKSRIWVYLIITVVSLAAVMIVSGRVGFLPIQVVPQRFFKSLSC